MDAVTLHREDFRVIHNTLCELRDLQKMVTVQPLSDLLLKIVGQFEQGLENAYAEDERKFDAKSDHYLAVKSELGVRSIWSIYSVEELGQPHPYGDIREICYQDHWGDSAVSEAVLGSTWKDLYSAADRCIQRSGDGAHIFIESFEPVADQPQKLRLTTGS